MPEQLKNLFDLPESEYISMGEIARKASIDIIRFVAESKNAEDISNFIIGRVWRAIVEGRTATIKNAETTHAGTKTDQ